ncbi:MAG: type II and III secretion system protein, partial [Planctomycetaceae bacterium]|nr:type II and III secretion system protein [Planctomycetaceae bacterium]
AYPIVVQDAAGIILTVTPRISPEENIVMEVVAEKSAFTGAGVTIFVDTTNGNEITSPIKDITTARTTVGVPNGQTIVLGGMITKNDETIERKVPWLGDLPYLGLPFRYDSTRTRRTELLIFLTPRIIRGDADNELIKQVESERLHWVEQEAEEIHGPIFEIPGPAGLPGWMDGPDYCPPSQQGTPIPQGTPTWDGAPSGSEMTVPSSGNPIPTPAPAAPPVGQDGPSMPVIPDRNMSWRQVEPKRPGQMPPNGGIVQTSASVPQSGGGQQRRPQMPAKSEPKRPWYALGKR